MLLYKSNCSHKSLKRFLFWKSEEKFVTEPAGQKIGVTLLQYNNLYKNSTSSRTVTVQPILNIIVSKNIERGIFVTKLTSKNRRI